jgi:hypothetical protein
LEHQGQAELLVCGRRAPVLDVGAPGRTHGGVHLGFGRICRLPQIGCHRTHGSCGGKEGGKEIEVETPPSESEQDTPDQDVEGPKVISRVGGIRAPPLYRSMAGDVAETAVEPRSTTRCVDIGRGRRPPEMGCAVVAPGPVVGLHGG